jgi:hypothetical protein
MNKGLIVIVLVSFISLGTLQKPAVSRTHFKLVFDEIGLGSNRFTKMPRFEIINSNFIYFESLKWRTKGQAIESPDTICTGIVRASSLDSLVDLMKICKDTTKYSHDGIMSGTIHHLKMEYGNKKVMLTFNNTYDSVITDVISILNTYIPKNKRKIYPHIHPPYNHDKAVELMEVYLKKRKTRK